MRGRRKEKRGGKEGRGEEEGEKAKIEILNDY